MLFGIQNENANLGKKSEISVYFQVHGNTYINRKMFEIRKNTQQLRNGGVIR